MPAHTPAHTHRYIHNVNILVPTYINAAERKYCRRYRHSHASSSIRDASPFRAFGFVLFFNAPMQSIFLMLMGDGGIFSLVCFFSLSRPGRVCKYFERPFSPVSFASSSAFANSVLSAVSFRAYFSSKLPLHLLGPFVYNT